MKTNIDRLLVRLLLTIIFIALKLDGVLQWNWIWVVHPIWVYALVDMVVDIIVAIIMSFENRAKNKPFIAQGKPLIWDAKTQTMYGPFGVDY